jgi:hypothetical protein
MMGEREGADAMRQAHLDVRALLEREGVIDS